MTTQECAKELERQLNMEWDHIKLNMRLRAITLLSVALIARNPSISRSEIGTAIIGYFTAKGYV